MFERKGHIRKVGYIRQYPREIIANNSLGAERPTLTTLMPRNIPCSQLSCPLKSSKTMYGRWDSLLVPQCPWICLLLPRLLKLGQLLRLKAVEDQEPTSSAIEQCQTHGSNRLSSLMVRLACRSPTLSGSMTLIQGQVLHYKRRNLVVEMWR